MNKRYRYWNECNLYWNECNRCWKESYRYIIRFGKWTNMGIKGRKQKFMGNSFSGMGHVNMLIIQ
jgi:hypothetical protein